MKSHGRSHAFLKRCTQHMKCKDGCMNGGLTSTADDKYTEWYEHTKQLIPLWICTDATLQIDSRGSIMDGGPCYRNESLELSWVTALIFAVVSNA